MALAEWELDWLMSPGDAPTLADLIPPKPRWMAQAACRGNPAPFFPVRDEPTVESREVCGRCPVSNACLDYALAEDLEGVWAGTSKRERRRMRRVAPT
jgi:WhiB family redox-sensing transcriptional regulator